MAYRPSYGWSSRLLLLSQPQAPDDRGVVVGLSVWAVQDVGLCWVGLHESRHVLDASHSAWAVGVDVVASAAMAIYRWKLCNHGAAVHRQ
jgi:hypothetical protein